MHTLTKRSGIFGLIRESRAAICLLLLSFSPWLHATDTFCALTVTVENPDGKPARFVWAELIDPTGKVVVKRLLRDSMLRICDFGFGAHSVRLFPNECHPITISNLRLRLGHPISLHVRRSPCSDEAHTGCDVLLRVVDKDGNKLRNVRITEGERQWPGRTDEYGRIAAGLVEGERQITFSAEGYDDKTFPLTCAGQDIEQEIVLTKKTADSGNHTR